MDAWRGAAVPELPGSGPEVKLRDTATGELTVAASGHRASLYACGITPYDATHMGHAATFTAWDLIVRSWLDAGHEVDYTQNVTDIDDPLLERAERDGEDWWQLARRETDRFRGDMEALRNLPPTHYIGAVEAIPIIGKYNERLAARGALYDVDGDTYFARTVDQDFGALAGPGTACGLSIPEMTALSAERGGDPDRPGKKDPLDPLVWRAQRPGEPSWDSRLGRGRPGWHVECAAIAAEYLGPSFDVQAGGSDLVFPHHEMSASHARVAYARVAGALNAGALDAGALDAGASDPGALDASAHKDTHVFARVYAHSGMVAYQGAKMSKSLGNLVFVSKLRAGGTDPMAIRLALIAHHYRSDWEWTDAVLAQAQSRLDRWRAAVSPARHPVGDGAPSPAANAVLAEVRERLADDLDTPGAVAAVDAWADTLLTGGAAQDFAAEDRALGDGAAGNRAAEDRAAGDGGAEDDAAGDRAHGTGMSGASPRDAALIRATVDALLGVAL